jgi:hypothetical protein
MTNITNLSRVLLDHLADDLADHAELVRNLSTFAIYRVSDKMTATVTWNDLGVVTRVSYHHEDGESGHIFITYQKSKLEALDSAIADFSDEDEPNFGCDFDAVDEDEELDVDPDLGSFAPTDSYWRA